MFIWLNGGVTIPGVIELQVSDPDDLFEVSKRAFEGARAVEELLEQHQDRIIDPPLDSEYCVSPERYPDLWKDDAWCHRLEELAQLAAGRAHLVSGAERAEGARGRGAEQWGS